jgi:cytochrome c oxidase subunit II
MLVVIVLVLVAVGSVVFHFMSPWWWTPIASNWGYIDDTIIITFWVTGIGFVAVLAFVAYCVLRFRHKAGHRADYDPENSKLEWWLTILTTVGVAAMLTPGLFVWGQFITVPKDAALVEAMGQQWQWTYRYPGKDGVMGTTDAKFINDKNPFGLNPADPKGRDDVLIGGAEMHLPLGKPVKFLLRSIDVLHDFYVPEFRAKMDLIPGAVTYFWLTPTRTGTFDVLCFELCGLGHHAMRGKVTVEDDKAFQAWLQQQPTFARSMADAGIELDPIAEPVLIKAEKTPALSGVAR